LYEFTHWLVIDTISRAWRRMPAVYARGELREVIGRALLVHQVAAAVEDRLVDVHPRPVRAEHRLRHEGRVHVVPARDLAHEVAERHDLVRHRERVGVAHVDFVLRRRDLVVAALDDRAHRRHRGHRLLAQLGAEVVVDHVEVAGRVEQRRIGRRLDVEVFELGPVYIVMPFASIFARFFRSTQRGSPWYGRPSG
jgi:hypothetical protein